MKKADKEKKEEIMSPTKLAFSRLMKNKFAIVGIIVVVALIIFSFIGPFFVKYGMNEQSNVVQQGMFTKGHILGTDKLGRDILARLMYGGRISILVGIISVAVEMVVGTLIGAVAGYYGGKIDSFLSMLAEVFMSLPFLPVVILIGAVLSEMNVDPYMRIVYLIISMGILNWGQIARLVRGEVLKLKEQEFIQATEALGLRDSRKILVHLIPNILPILIVQATLSVGSYIILESTLSYLGVGVQEPISSWGNMMKSASTLANLQKRPWLWAPAGICIVAITLAINAIGDALRDALDPKKNR